jgi:hypothetical protein
MLRRHISNECEWWEEACVDSEFGKQVGPCTREPRLLLNLNVDALSLSAWSAWLQRDL